MKDIPTKRDFLKEQYMQASKRLSTSNNADRNFKVRKQKTTTVINGDNNDDSLIPNFRLDQSMLNDPD